MSNSTNIGRREQGGGIGEEKEEENGSVLCFFVGLGLMGEVKKASL
jgi:hypothetical protein